MIKRSELRQYQQQMRDALAAAGIVLTERESQSLEVAEFGLGDFKREGLGLLVYANNERYCAKELVLWPRQTCPQHRHPPVGGDPGKMETFRCRKGVVWLYIAGNASSRRSAVVPAGSEAYYDVFCEIELKPGDQYTIPPDTWHWFQAGDEGAIVSEFSSVSRDECDVFADPCVERLPRIEED